MARKKRDVENPLLGEYMVDLTKLGDTPLAKIIGNVTTPILLEVLQERLLSYLEKEQALTTGTRAAPKRIKKREPLDVV